MPGDVLWCASDNCAKEASIIEKKGRAKRKKWSSDELLRPSHMPGHGVLVCMDTYYY